MQERMDKVEDMTSEERVGYGIDRACKAEFVRTATRAVAQRSTERRRGLGRCIPHRSMLCK